MKLGLAVIALAAIPSLPASARPITAGVGLGLTESKADTDYNADANHTLELFGRVGLTSRISGQLEIERIQTDDPNVDIRTISGLMVVELAQPDSHVMPLLLAGMGYDHAGTQYGGSTEAHHIEGGLALEYRADGGFTIGASARLGGRSIDSDTTIVPLANIALYQPSYLREGEYRSLGMYAGVRF
jgi:hypothetical protein